MSRHLPPGHLPPGHLPPGHLPDGEVGEGGGGGGNVSAVAPTYRSTDAQTLARKFNEGAQRMPSYEFGGGRRKFYQPRDQES